MTHPPFSVPPVKITRNVHCASQQSTNTKFTTDEISSSNVWISRVFYWLVCSCYPCVMLEPHCDKDWVHTLTHGPEISHVVNTFLWTEWRLNGVSNANVHWAAQCHLESPVFFIHTRFTWLGCSIRHFTLSWVLKAYQMTSRVKWNHISALHIMLNSIVAFISSRCSTVVHTWKMESEYSLRNFSIYHKSLIWAG